MTDARSDEELMLSYARGDADAFETLYRRHRGGLYRYLRRQCDNTASAEELFQEVCTGIIRTRKSYTVGPRPVHDLSLPPGAQPTHGLLPQAGM